MYRIWNGLDTVKRIWEFRMYNVDKIVKYVDVVKGIVNMVG